MRTSQRLAPACPAGFAADEINALKSSLRRSMGMLCKRWLEQTSFVSAAQIWRGKIKRHIEGCVQQGHNLNDDIEKTAQLAGYKLGCQNLDY